MSTPLQASPKASKPSNDEYFGLTKAQVKLLLLGSLFTDDAGKVDFERLANKAQITVASARTMYPKAKKKFRELHNSDATSPEDNANTTTGDDGTPKAKKTHAPPKPRGRKRKQVDDESADVKDEPAESADESLQQVEVQVAKTELADDIA